MPAFRWNVTQDSTAAQRLWLPPEPDGPNDDARARDTSAKTEAIHTPTALPAELAREVLRSVVVAEVIPRLLSAGSGGADDDTISAFTGLLMQHDSSAAISMIEDAIDADVPIETVFLDLLTPAARLLGHMWEQDTTDFVTVTSAMFHLQQVLLHVSPAFRQERAQTGRAFSALLTVVPGGQHTFGVQMLAEFFRREGWQVQQPIFERITDLTRTVRRNWLSLVGLSVSSTEQLEAADQCIRSMRQYGRNRDMLIMVGGTVINNDPNLVTRLGADFTAVDGRQAVIQARRLLRVPASAAD